jgi:type 1 glutamine amidotransferase
MQLLANQLEKEHEFIDVRVYFDGWPTDDERLKGTDCVVMYSDGADKSERDHPLLLGGRMKYLDELFDAGTGLVFLHYSLIVPQERAGAMFEKWIGGYFDYESGEGENNWYSQIETREFAVTLPSPEHAICRGVKPFTTNEEYYFKLRFRDGETGLTAIASLNGGKKNWENVVGWTSEGATGTRGFGYTGGHFYKNFEDPNIQRLLLNGILWTAKAERYIPGKN